MPNFSKMTNQEIIKEFNHLKVLFDSFVEGSKNRERELQYLDSKVTLLTKENDQLKKNISEDSFIFRTAISSLIQMLKDKGVTF